MEFKAYILLEDLNYQDSLNNIIEQLFPSYVLSWNDTIASIVVNDDPAFQLKLEKLHTSAFFDLNILLSILIVPTFNKIFIKYLKKIKNEVLTAYEIFSRLSHNKETKKDADTIKESIGEDNINTIRAYLKCNINANAAAEELFLHKNSYAYRIKKFTNETTYDYNDFNTLLFLKLILTITN